MLLLLLGCAANPIEDPEDSGAPEGLERLAMGSCPEGDRSDGPLVTHDPGWAAPAEDNPDGQYTGGGGIVAADLNGDGCLDLYLPSTGPGQLLLSDGPGSWQDAPLPEESGPGVGGALRAG